MDKKMNRKEMHHEGMGHRASSGPVRGPARQRGAVLVLVAVGMLAIIGMAGLALQSGHLLVDKTQVQNALDAAALSAAKTLNNDGSVAQAQTAGQVAFEKHRALATGNSTFLEREVRDASYTLAFQFSATLDPFTPGATETSIPPATFVRARATDFTIDTWLANVLPGVGAQQDIGGTAVAGPVPIDTNNPRNIAPLIMCGKPPPAGMSGAQLADYEDCSDGDCFGYNPPPGPDYEFIIKTGTGPNTNQQGTTGVAPGDFQLFQRLDGGVFESLAGGYSIALTGPTIQTTQHVNDADALRRGWNTRFGMPESSPDYPPDTVVHYNAAVAGTQDMVPRNNGLLVQKCDFCYDDYVQYQNSGQYRYLPQPRGIGVPDRRVMAMPIGDCTGQSQNGVTTVRRLGVACFFATRPATPDQPCPQANGGNGQGNGWQGCGQGGPETWIYGQMIGHCQADGPIATTPPPAGGLRLYKIVLYKDPDSRDS